MSPDLKTLFRMIVERGQNSPPTWQTRKLPNADIVQRTDDVVLNLKRKTKVDRQQTRETLQLYFDSDRSFREERSIDMTFDAFQHHVKFYVKGRQTFRAAQVKIRDAQRYTQDAQELSNTVEALGYSWRWARFSHQRHGKYVAAHQVRHELKAKVSSVV